MLATTERCSSRQQGTAVAAGVDIARPCGIGITLKGVRPRFAAFVRRYLYGEYIVLFPS